MTLLIKCAHVAKPISEKSAFMDRILSLKGRNSAVVLSGVNFGIPHLLCEQVS